MRSLRPRTPSCCAGRVGLRCRPDLAGGRTSSLDAYATARFVPGVTLQVGKFKVPVGLERIQSASDIRFIERGFPTSLLPNRDLGVQLSGEGAGGALDWAVGYFNGVTDGGSSDGGTPADAETDTRGDWAGRVFVQPFLATDLLALRGLGIGLGATWVDVGGVAATPKLPAIRTPGQQSFFAYR